jgi:hypothetical protein
VSNWTEFDIGLVYFTGLIISLVASLILIGWIRPVKIRPMSITGNSSLISVRTFITSLVIVSLLGAMSVSFRDCHGNYDALLNSKTETIMKGASQLSAALQYLKWITLFWLLIFAFLYVFKGKRTSRDAEKI